MKIGSIPIIFSILLFSCTAQEICEDDGQSLLVARFKTIGAEAVKDTIISGVTLYGIRDNRPDSLLYDSITLSRILLPLDPGHGFSRFVLRINEQADTLQITHTNEFYLISYTCGFGALFTLGAIDFTGAMVHGAEIINAVIDADLMQNEEHLWIYF